MSEELLIKLFPEYRGLEQETKCVHCYSTDVKFIGMVYYLDLDIERDFLYACENCHKGMRITIDTAKDEFVDVQDYKLDPIQKAGYFEILSYFHDYFGRSCKLTMIAKGYDPNDIVKFRRDPSYREWREVGLEGDN